MRRYREDVVPAVMLVSLFIALLGHLAGWETARMVGAVGAGLTMLTVFPVLAFEYCADLKREDEPE